MRSDAFKDCSRLTTKVCRGRHSKPYVSNEGSDQAFSETQLKLR